MGDDLWLSHSTHVCLSVGCVLLPAPTPTLPLDLSVGCVLPRWLCVALQGDELLPPSLALSCRSDTAAAAAAAAAVHRHRPSYRCPDSDVTVACLLTVF